MKRTSRSFLVSALLVALVLFLQGAQCPDVNKLNDSVEKVNGTLSQAVHALDSQSSAWQQTLKDLQTQLAADSKGLVNEIANDAQNLIAQIDTVVKDGMQFGQELFNCQLDIFSKHASIALKNLQNDFLNRWHYQGISNRQPVPHTPIVCSANPNSINVASWNPSTVLVLSGTDLNLLDTSSPTVIVVRGNGSEAALAHMGNRMTNYRFSINVPMMIAQNLLVDAVQLQIRWNGQQVNQNEIPVASCGMIGGPCCGGRCSQGSCTNSVCSACGHLGEPCCDSGVACSGNGVGCLSKVCSLCGGLGQSCCVSGVACSAPATGCLSGHCSSCPAAPKPQVLFSKPGEQAGPHCWPESGSDYTVEYGSACHSNFHRQQCLPSVNHTCDTCSAVESWSTSDASDCKCKVHFRSPQDCFKYIQVDIKIYETENAPPRPVGCP